MSALNLPSTEAWRVGVAPRWAIAAALAAMLAVGTLSAVAALGTDPGRPDIVDFHEFYLAGRLVWEGRLDQAYHAATMMGLERGLGGGRDVFLPFAYPPLFGLAVAWLPALPVGAAFVLFEGATLALLLVVLRRAAGAWFWTVLLATSPAILIDLRIGQNGLLTAALAGLATLAALDGASGKAGLAAGLLAALKPHLAATLPLLFLLRGDRRALLVSVATCLAATGMAIVLLRPGIVPAFLAGLAEMSRYAAIGAVPLHRMVSLDAALLSLGCPPATALVLHGFVALGVLALTARASRTIGDQRAAAGLVVMAAAFVSPYLYDYDLAILGVGLGLALPALSRRTNPRRLGLVLAAAAAAQGAGLLSNALGPGASLSLGGPVLLSCVCGILAILRRPAEIVPRGHDLSPARGPA